MKKELAEKEHQLSAKPTEKAADSELSWLNVLSQETGENVQERINLQKALFELEETNKRNRMELQHLDDAIARRQVCIFTHLFQICFYSEELGAPNSIDNSGEPIWSCAFPFPPLSRGKNIVVYRTSCHHLPIWPFQSDCHLPRQLFLTCTIL